MRRDHWNFPSLYQKMAHDLIFKESQQKKLFRLAMKIIKGSEFTADDLQLQANEPEALEKMLKEIKEFQEKRA